MHACMKGKARRCLQAHGTKESKDKRVFIASRHGCKQSNKGFRISNKYLLDEPGLRWREVSKVTDIIHLADTY